MSKKLEKAVWGSGVSDSCGEQQKSLFPWPQPVSWRTLCRAVCWWGLVSHSANHCEGEMGVCGICAGLNRGKQIQDSIRQGRRFLLRSQSSPNQEEISPAPYSLGLRGLGKQTPCHWAQFWCTKVEWFRCTWTGKVPLDRLLSNHLSWTILQ